MNYPESLRYLNTFQNFEKINLKKAPAWSLERMKLLLRRAAHPEKTFLPVLIAGTKGKGSTGFFLESILKESGTRAGFYSSPHLEDPRERIRVQGKIISKENWIKGLRRIRALLSLKDQKSVTYFEVMTLLAAMEFKRAGVSVGIFEVGMGGRLDATNAVEHQLAVITPIGLDHEAVLGKTIAKIAAEKAAILRPGEPAVISPQPPEASRVIKAFARHQGAKLWKVSAKGLPKIELGLQGDYQKVNASAALKAAELLKSEFGIKVTAQGVQKGLQAHAWPGRFETLSIYKKPWLLDAAHNPISIEALVRNLKAHYANRPRILIFGTSRDKNSAAMLRLLAGFFKEIILTRAQSSRSVEIPVLMAQARGQFERIYPAGTVSEALSFAGVKFAPETLRVVTGSFYVLGEARKRLQGKK